MDDFVAALLRQMTLAEKIGQLNLLSAGEGPDTGTAGVRNIRERLEKGALGAIFGTKSVRSVRAWQELALEGSRLGIPLFFAEDVIHGHRTIFPLPIGLASAFDPALWERVARVAACETSAEGINHVYAPMVDITRDARWGRVAEGPGEDPFLAARYAEAMVRGLEGDDPLAPDTVVACLKHFVAYGAAVGGRDYDNASLDPQAVIGVYAAPFRAGVAAGAGSIMTAFNAVNRVPMHAHRELISGWLRGRAGFEGLVVSDYTGVAELTPHGMGDPGTVAVLALLAGVDMDMIGENYLNHLPRLAETGLELPEAGLSVSAEEIVAAIDLACARVLSLKKRVGLFEDPFRYCDEGRAARFALSAEHRAVARQSIAETAVLLKNDKGVLPLAPDARVALVGAVADDRSNLLGTWSVSGDPSKAVTVREGLAALHKGPITCSRGADIESDPTLAARLNVFGETVTLDARSGVEMVEEALAAAREADVVVAIVGEAKEHSGESSSRSEIELPASQRRLVEALGASGTPLVLVVMTGRPLALAREVALADAVLVVWFAGTEAGNGIADVLTGAADPAGRLAMTFPARTGQVPVYHAADPTGRPYTGKFEKFRTGYLDLPDAVPPATGLFPFGFGLSYAQFRYGAPRVDDASPSGDARVTVSFEVENVGARAGSTVAQLYVCDPVARITRPMAELAGFRKMELAPGETRTVSFALTREDLSYAMGETFGTVEWVWDPGTFVMMTGPDSRDLQSVEITWSR